MKSWTVLNCLLPNPGAFTNLFLSLLDIIETSANRECLKVFPSFGSPVSLTLLPVLASIISTGAEWKLCQGFVLALFFSFYFNMDSPLTIKILETNFFKHTLFSSFNVNAYCRYHRLQHFPSWLFFPHRPKGKTLSNKASEKIACVTLFSCSRIFLDSLLPTRWSTAFKSPLPLPLPLSFIPIWPHSHCCSTYTLPYTCLAHAVPTLPLA